GRAAESCGTDQGRCTESWYSASGYTHRFAHADGKRRTEEGSGVAAGDQDGEGAARAENGSRSEQHLVRPSCTSIDIIDIFCHGHGGRARCRNHKSERGAYDGGIQVSHGPPGERSECGGLYRGIPVFVRRSSCPCRNAP